MASQVTHWNRSQAKSTDQFGLCGVIREVIGAVKDKQIYTIPKAE